MSDNNNDIWSKINPDEGINFQYHECAIEDVEKFPSHFHRDQIRLIHDETEADSIIHWWSLFDGNFDHHILCCPYCGAMLT